MIPPFAIDPAGIPTEKEAVVRNLDGLIGYAELQLRQDRPEGDERAYTVAALRYLVQVLRRLQRLQDEDVDFLAWTARCLLELLLLTRYALASPENLLTVMLWRIAEYQDVRRALFDGEPADPADGAAVDFLLSVEGMEAWAEREGLTVPKRLNQFQLAKATDSLDEFYLCYKPLSKYAHPTPLLLFGNDGFVRGPDSRRVQLVTAQLFAARLLDELPGLAQGARVQRGQ